jgi:hypothetical protein
MHCTVRASTVTLFFRLARTQTGRVARPAGLLQSGLRGVWGLSASAYPASADEELADNDADEFDKLRRAGFPLIPFTQVR